MRFSNLTLLILVSLVFGILMYLNRPADDSTALELIQIERENDFPSETSTIELTTNKEIYNPGETVEVAITNNGEGTSVSTHDTGLTLDVAADENTWENRQNDEDLIRSDVLRGIEPGETREHELRLPRQFNNTVMRVVLELESGNTLAVPFYVR